MSDRGSMWSAQLAVFLGANTISSVGTWVHNVAASIYIFDATGSSLAVGAVTTAQFAGTVLLAPWAGAAADKVDLRKLIGALQVAGAVSALLLALANAAGELTPLLLVVGSALIGALLGFGLPASQSLVPLLVSERRVASAVALNSVTYNVARALGPALAAVVLTTGGMTWAMLVNAASFAIYALGVRAARPVRSRPSSGSRVRSSFRGAVVLVLGNPRLRLLIITVAAVSTAADPVTTLAPGLVVEALGLDPGAVGWIVSSFGVGAVVSALVTVRVSTRGLPYLVGALIIEVLGVVAVALAPGEVIMALGMAIAGVGFIQSVSTATAMLHDLVPDEVVGRAMAVWGVAFLGTRPVASVCSGLLADATSPRLAAAVMPLAALGAVWLLLRQRSVFGVE